MRPPRVRFTVKGMMVAVAVLSVGLRALTNVIADGHRDIPIGFLVLDAGGLPIRAAEITLSEFNRPQQQSVTTDHGEATPAGVFRIAYRGSLLCGRLTDGYAPRSVLVEATGFEPRGLEIGDQQLDADYHREGTTPPRIVVRLRRAAR